MNELRSIAGGKLDSVNKIAVKLVDIQWLFSPMFSDAKHKNASGNNAKGLH